MAIRKLILILIVLMATAPLGIFIYSAANQRTHDINQAINLSAAITNKVLTEQNILASGAEQLAVTLSQVPAIREHDAAGANRLLQRLLAASPQFTTIFAMDTTGVCWAAALPEQISLSYAERRYFRNAMATGNFSSGEYNVGKVVRSPIFSFAYPVKDTSGSITGVVAIVINLERYRQLYEQKKFSLSDSSIVLVDHKGTILFSSFDPGMIGEQDKIFQRMTGESDEGTFEAPGNQGGERLFTYKKLYLKNESAPYLYVRTGVDKKGVLDAVHRDFLLNVGILTLVMLFTLGLAILLTKHGLHDKIVTLRNATDRIALGDLSVRVAERVSGGELGELGRAFDTMSTRLSETILERQQAEQNLQKSEEEFRLIFEGASDAIFWADATTGVLINCNRAAEQMLELPREEIIGKHHTFLHPPEMFDHFARSFRECAADSVVFPNVEAIVQAKRSGRLIPVEIRHSVTTIGNTKIMQGLFRDTSERRKAEEELIHFQKLLTGIVDNSPFAIFVKDVADDFKVILWNRAAEHIFGIPAATIIGKTTHDLWPKEQADAYLNEDLKTVHQRVMVDIPEEASNHPQRGMIYLHTRKVPLFGQNGEVSHIVVISDDITERRTIQAEIIKHQKLESLGILAGGIAHDFNNILTGILGNISFARMFLEPSHKAAAILTEAEKASQRAADLAYQLLTFAKGGKPIKKAVQVRHLVETSLSLVLRGSNVKCIVEIPDTLSAIEADEGQIHQVFNNIIINAAQSMPGGGTLTICVDQVNQAGTGSGLDPGSYARITFADSGCGIPEQDQKRIFDPYFTTKDGGSGLGLASAHSIISKHGGSISAHSTPGSGTTFEILLPISLGEAPVTPGDVSVAATAQGHGKTLLVMDDDLMIRDLAANMLGELGYRVKTCATGEEAVERYRLAQQTGEPFAAAIMDLTIPGGMGGREAAEQILKQNPQACLVVSSGYCNDPVMADYRSYGFSAAMIKPYSVSSVAQILDDLFTESTPPDSA